MALAICLAFIAVSVAMECYARQRFTVPSKADISAVPSGPQRIHIERARLLAPAQRDAWLPYRAYATAMNVLMLLALVLGLLGFRSSGGRAFAARRRSPSEAC